MNEIKTKADALRKLEELRRYVAKLEEQETEYNFELGDVYEYKGGEKAVILREDWKSDRFMIGGCGGNPLQPFSNSAMDRETMVAYLKGFKYRRVGKMVIQNNFQY